MTTDPEPKAPNGTGGIGHNGADYTFEDDTDAIVEFGPVVASFRRIGFAIRDPRCHKPHLRVLYNIMERLSRIKGTAFPNRRTVAEDEGLDLHTVENVLYDLRKWGHIDWAKRVDPELHRGRLLHYTLPIKRWPEDRLRAAIAAAVYELRGSTRPNGYSADKYPSQRVHAPTGTPDNEVPARTGKESTRPDVCSNLYKGTGRDSPPTSIPRNGLGLHNERGTRGAAAKPDEAELAVAAYNDAAHAQGFTPCGKLTPQIHKRLDKRLAEIGGLEAFKRAISAIHLDDFLAGRVRQDCRRPFKLNLERLLRADGGMGDVLAMLLGLADEAAQSTGAGAGTDAQRELRETLARMRAEEDSAC